MTLHVPPRSATSFGISSGALNSYLTKYKGKYFMTLMLFLGDSPL